MRNFKLGYHLGFLLVLILSGVYYYLRVPYNAAALEFFQLINNNGFWQSWEFWWHIPVLLPTFLALKLGASLKVLMIIYALSYPFFCYIVFLILTYGFKDKHAGAFLLLLYLGVGESFFIAKNDVLYLLVWLYLFYTVITYYIERKQGRKLNEYIDLSFFFVMLLAIFWKGLQVIPFEHNFAIGSDFYYETGFQYMKQNLLSIYLLVGLLAAYLTIFFIVRKQWRPLIFIYVFVCVVLLLFSSKKGYAIDMEMRLLPVVFFFLILFKKYILDRFEYTRYSCVIIYGLIFLAVCAPLRFTQTYEKRFTNLGYLLDASNSVEHSKLALSEHLQIQDRYINPEYLPIESTLITALNSTVPNRSIFFYPDNFEKYKNAEFIFSAEKYFETYSLNPDYFKFSDKYYFDQKTRLIETKLIIDAFCGAELVVGRPDLNGYYLSETDSSFKFSNTLNLQSKEVYEGQYAVHTVYGLPYAFTIDIPDMERGDSVVLSVYRKGGDDGHMVLTDDRHGTGIYIFEQIISDPDENGWQKLRLQAILPAGVPKIKCYVYNASKGDNLVYFDNFSIRVWREKYEKK